MRQSDHWLNVFWEIDLSNNKIDLNKNYKIELPSARTVLINLAIGLVIGYLGPFGTFEMALLQRIMYWIILIFAGYFIYAQVEKVSQWYFHKRKTHILLMFLIPPVIGSIFLSFVVAYVSYLFVGMPLIFPASFFFFFPKVLILGITLQVFNEIMNRARSNPTETIIESINTSKKHLDFLNRIPDKLGDDLICFSMEDHYLQVHTDKGNHMILMRMKDALKELQDYHGIQVHRSWWIAIDAVIDVKKTSRKATLTMKNDMQVPVSQKYLSVLKEVGLIP